MFCTVSIDFSQQQF